MTPRSMLFVPGDSEKKLAKAVDTQADALILDIEDSVAPERKGIARDSVRAHLLAQNGNRKQGLWVRINPLDTPEALHDLAAIVAGRPDVILLPKANGAGDVVLLDHYLTALEIREGLVPGIIKVIVVATETGAAMFGLGTYTKATPRLHGLTWGAEDLATAVGAASNSDASGHLTPLYTMARALCLCAAAAAEVEVAIDTAYMGIGDPAGLRLVCDEARRDGFRSKLAIHPDQIAIINDAFSPSDAEVAHAQKIRDLFAANPGVGTPETGRAHAGYSSSHASKTAAHAARRIAERLTGSPMYFELSAELEGIRESVGRICEDFPDEYWLKADQEARFPKEFHRAMADAGYLGITMPEEYGGSGLGRDGGDRDDEHRGAGTRHLCRLFDHPYQSLRPACDRGVRDTRAETTLAGAADQGRATGLLWRNGAGRGS